MSEPRSNTALQYFLSVLDLGTRPNKRSKAAKTHRLISPSQNRIASTSNLSLGDFSGVKAALSGALLSIVLVGIMLQPSPAAADPRGERLAGATLFSGGALKKAEEKRNERSRESSGGRRSRFVDSSSSDAPDHSDSIDDLIALESAEELLDEGGSGLFPQKAPVSILYLSNVTNLDDYIEWESRTVAERMFLYQSFSALSKVVVGSALEPLYRKTLRGVRLVRDYTSVKFSRSEKGTVSVVDSDEKPLVEMKLHISANNGVEPRVEVGDHMMLRYNLFDQDTLIEFRSNF